jgi:hypothetical protein
MQALHGAVVDDSDEIQASTLPRGVVLVGIAFLAGGLTATIAACLALL